MFRKSESDRKKDFVMNDRVNKQPATKEKKKRKQKLDCIHKNALQFLIESKRQ